MTEYAMLKEFARENGVRIKDLIALAPSNDPFYADVPYRRERAEWFAALWHRFGFSTGLHLRRIHYLLVSQPEPVRLPNGDAYENTTNHWHELDVASLAARVLEVEHELYPAVADHLCGAVADGVEPGSFDVTPDSTSVTSHLETHS